MIDLDAEIETLGRQLKQLVQAAAPATTSRIAVSTGHAGTLLVAAGQNIERLRSEASFAALCGASPLPVASGRTDRHRLNYGGDRDANRALHMIAVCRLRYCERTRAYVPARLNTPRRAFRLVVVRGGGPGRHPRPQDSQSII